MSCFSRCMCSYWIIAPRTSNFGGAACSRYFPNQIPHAVENGGEGAMVVLDDAQGLHGSWLRCLSGIILRESYLLPH